MITDDIMVRCRADAHPVKTVWQWERSEPYLLTVLFVDKGEVIPWEFDRDLLADGLKGEAGEGDVQVRRRSDKEVSIRLESHDGTATYDAPSDALTKFLARTTASVPRSREHVDVDAALAKILAGA
jgi:hypothetical protein